MLQSWSRSLRGNTRQVSQPAASTATSTIRRRLSQPITILQPCPAAPFSTESVAHFLGPSSSTLSAIIDIAFRFSERLLGRKNALVIASPALIPGPLPGYCRLLLQH